MKENKPKIYRMNDCDAVIAYSKREAVDWYFKEMGCESRKDIAIECEREKDLSKEFWLSCWGPEELWERVIKLKQNEEIVVSNWAGDPAYKASFQSVIDDFLDKFHIPGLICSTEY